MPAGLPEELGLKQNVGRYNGPAFQGRRGFFFAFFSLRILELKHIQKKAAK